MSQRFLASILIVAFALAAIVLVVGLVPTDTVAAPTYINSDWDIDNGDVIERQDEEIVLTGDLTVKDGGLLTFRNVTLRMNSTSSTTYHIEVEDGGRFNIYDGDSDSSTADDASLITAHDASYNYRFWVIDGGELYFNNSDLQECGTSGVLQNRGLYLASSTCTISEVNITDGSYGIIAYYASPTIEDCIIQDSSLYAVYLYQSSSDINGCTIDTAIYGVLAYYSFPKISDTDIDSASSWAIYTYNAETEISGCTITSSGNGIFGRVNLVEISDCVIDDVTNYGIQVELCVATLTNNDINDATTGIYLNRASSGSTVTGGTIGNCTSNGVYGYITPAAISNVEVHDSSANGIYLNQGSGSVSGCWIEGAATGLYLRSSTASVTGLTSTGATTSGMTVTGGSPTLTGFLVGSSAIGITVDTTGTLRAYNGAISGSTTRDVDVSATSLAEMTNVSFSAAGSQVAGAGSYLRVFWYVDMHGIWQDGSDIPTGTYSVLDQGSATVTSGTLDANGWVNALRIRQLEIDSTGSSSDTPHTFNVGKGGLTGLAAANIDSNQLVTVAVTDNVPPSGYSMGALSAFSQGTVRSVSWTAGTDTGVGGMEYYCEIATDAAFTSVIYGSGWTTSLTYTFIGLADGTTYHYHVRAQDAVGNLGVWSSGVSSTQDSSPPSVPVVVGEPTYTQGTTNTISWGTSTDGGIGSVEYQTQYTDDPTFNTVLGTGAWSTSTSITVAGLTDDTTYYYRVKAHDGFSQESSWSPPVSSTQDNSAPTRPNQVTLPSYTQGLSVTFEWLASTDDGVGGIEYYAEYDTQSWFPSPDGNSGWVSGLSHTFNGLPENTWHYYRVRAQDALGQQSTWSVITWTRNDNTPPTVPVMGVEPQYTVGNSNTVSWSASTDTSGSGGIQYWVEADTSAFFSSPDFSSSWQTARSFDFSSLVDGSTYYFRVRAKDALDQESSWSSTVSSTQDASAPPVPSLATEPTYTAGTTNTVEWTAVTDDGVGGEQYSVQISSSPVFASSLATTGWMTATSFTFTSLSDDIAYYYRVHSRDSFAQVSQWSGTVSSTQDASAPPAPTMKQADWYNPGLYFVAEWTAVSDSGVGGVEYYSEYDDAGNFASPNGNSGWTTALEFNFTGLQENRWYYYHVKARDALGQEGLWSPSIFARQDNSPPTAPTLTAEPVFTAGTTNTVSWSASTDTGGIWQISYQVEIGTTPSFAPPLQTSTWITQRSYTFTGLQNGVLYYYQVRAKDGLDQESAWSAAVASTQDASPPPSPTMAAEPAFTQGTSNTVSWTPVTDNSGGTVSYRVYASLSSVFATTEGDSGWRTTATWTFSGLTDGSTYHYRVRARDQFLQEGFWSNIVSSTQDATAPTGYSMVTEPTYTQGTTNTVEWNAGTDSGSGGVEYECERWTAGTTPWTTQLTNTFTSLPENTWLYYHVRARDAVGNTGGWSSWTVSRQDASAPSLPTMTALAQFSQGTSKDVSWSASSDGAGIGQVTYKVQYAASGSFSPVLAESLWQSERTYTFSGLQDSQTYYFRTRAKDGLDQESGWSGWVSTTMDSQAPPAPFLFPEPTYTQGTSNILSWSVVADSGVGNVDYEIEASTVPSFAAVAATSGWITGTTITFNGLTDGTLYYYRVHARDGFRQAGQWSNVERSTQDATAPPAPTITTEPTYTAGTSNTIFWNAVIDGTSGGVEYWVEYDNDFLFRSPNGNSGWIPGTQFTFNSLAENTWWFYRVRARDAAGNIGAWSATTWSRQDNTAPTAPTMTAEPAFTPGTTNTVGWSASNDGGGSWGITYKAEISTTNTFTTVISESAWITSQSWTFSGLVDGWTYYYRVQARDALDHVSSYSNVVFSTQDASAPTAPFLTAEPEYTSGTANTIAWTAVGDGGVGGVEYEAQASASPTFTTVSSSGWIRGTSHTFSALADGTTYYYRVHSRDLFGQVSMWSNVERSTQDNSPPTVPNFPAPTWIQQGTDIILKWDPSTDAGVGGVQYWIEYDNDFLFRSVNGNSGWITATDHTFTDLAENTWWFFRVRSRDAFGQTSAWSPTRWSRLDASPPTTPIMRIEPSYTEGTSNNVQWQGSTDSGIGGVQYQVYVDNTGDMGSPMFSSGWITSLSYTFSGLADGMTYFYAVQSRDSFDQRSPYSNVVSSTQDNSPPSTPVMELEPEFTKGTLNTVAWSKSEDAGVGGVLYQLQWSTSSVFSTITGELDRMDGNSATISNLSDGTRYYYRIRSRDSFNHFTPWSNIVWSTQDSSAPPVPGMHAEPTFTPGISNSVSWDVVTDKGIGSVEYYTELSTDGAFTNPFGSGWTTSTKWTWNNLADGNRYWYRVRSRDGFDQQSAWSAFVSSTQDDRAPPVPTLAAEPTVTKGTTNTLSWTNVTDAGVGGVTYEVQFSTSSNFGTVGGSSGWVDSTSHTFSGLSDGVMYYYRVRAKDAFEHVSGWSAIRNSQQDASPPSQPSLSAEDQFTQGTSNSISWSNSVDAGIGGVQYYAEAASDGAFSSIVGTYGWGGETSANFTGLTDGVTYYYRVRARDAFDFRSPWSNVERSTQDASPPGRPTMAPLPTYTEGTSINVAWSVSIDTGIGGVQYYVEWDNSPFFGSPNGNSGWVPIREWTFGSLPESQSLYYRVRARDALGQASAWSPSVSSIQDNSPPSTPSLNELPEFIKGRAVALSWNPAVDLGIAGVEYYAMWDDDPSFATPGGNSDWVASATHTFGGLPENVQIHFRVRARDAFGHLTPWAGGESATFDASAPTIPYLASEPLYTQGTINRLEWSISVDLGIGGVEYKVQATSDPTWSTVDKDSGWLRSTSFVFSGLADGTVYYYRVLSRDTFAWTSAWSPVVSSTQDASPPPVPFPDVLPAFTKGLDTTISWGPVMDAGVGGVGFMVEVSPVPTFSTLVDSSPWIMTTSYTFTDLAEGSPLYYRVRSRDGFDQRSAWSVSVTTTQDASPPQVPFLQPEPEYTAGSTNMVGWLPSFDAGVGGVRYMIEAATDENFDEIVATSGWIDRTDHTFRMLADGVRYHHRVRAQDAFEHGSGWSTAISSVQDASAPVVEFDLLPSVISNPVIELTGTAIDAGSGVADVELSSDGGSTWSAATYSAGVWSWTWTGYESGTQELWARGTDKLGNLLMDPTKVLAEVDLDAPEASITSPVINETLTGLVPVQGTAFDPHIALYNLYWTLDGVEWVPIVTDQSFSVMGGTLAIWDTRSLDDGEYELVLEVNDTSGRTTRSNVTCYLLNSDVLISPAELFLSNPFPFEGKNTTISATFRNSGTSVAKGVLITITDNGQTIYEDVHNIGAGDQLTILVPYIVPDHSKLHTIAAKAVYDDNTDPSGNVAATSYTGKEVIEEPFFDTSEWTLFGMFVALLVALLIIYFILMKRIGEAPRVPVTGLPASTDSLATFESIGGDQIQWDDDSF